MDPLGDSIVRISSYAKPHGNWERGSREIWIVLNTWPPARRVGRKT